MWTTKLGQAQGYATTVQVRNRTTTAEVITHGAQLRLSAEGLHSSMVGRPLGRDVLGKSRQRAPADLLKQLQQYTLFRLPTLASQLSGKSSQITPFDVGSTSFCPSGPRIMTDTTP